MLNVCAADVLCVARDELSTEMEEAAPALKAAIELFSWTVAVLRAWEADVLCAASVALSEEITEAFPVLRAVILEASLVLREARELFDWTTVVLSELAAAMLCEAIELFD